MANLNKMRHELTLGELVGHDKTYDMSIGVIEYLHHPEYHNFGMFPQLHEFFTERPEGNTCPHTYVYNKVTWNKFYRYYEFKLADNSRISTKQLMKMLLSAFRDSEHIAIKGASLVETPQYTDETFPELRKRCIWNIENMLGMSHGGKGMHSHIPPESKYYRGNRFKDLEEDGQYCLLLN